MIAQVMSKQVDSSFHAIGRPAKCQMAPRLGTKNRKNGFLRAIHPKMKVMSRHNTAHLYLEFYRYRVCVTPRQMIDMKHLALPLRVPIELQLDIMNYLEFWDHSKISRTSSTIWCGATKWTTGIHSVRLRSLLACNLLRSFAR